VNIVDPKTGKVEHFNTAEHYFQAKKIELVVGKMLITMQY